MSHVFISYSKQNKEYARKLADHLLSQGLNVWIDDRIEPSDEWWKTVVKAIRECAAFVVMTPQSGASRWVEREVMLADELQKPMFPVLLDGDLHASELWALFFGKQYEDARGGKLPAERFSTKLERSAPRKAGGGADVTTKPAINLRDWAPNFDRYEQVGSGSEQADVPEKPAVNLHDWTPDFDKHERDIDVSDEKIARFANLHRTWLQERREQRASNPPDVSHILPAPFEWCVVPAGEATVRFTPRARATTQVPTFSISKYPITNSQYQVFVDAQDGYRSPAWWGYSDEAKIWRRENEHPKITAFEGDDLPRTNVTWYEAVAFCQWLTGRIMPSQPGIPVSLTGNMFITLPTEQQWQRAAQGDDGREYPWGNQFDAACCNTTASSISKATPVTQYPCGVSLFGVMDMAGNVWEWCLSEWGTSEVSLKTSGERVLRGGSWGNAAHSATTGSRHRDFPNYGYDIYGFRVVCFAVGS